MKSNPTPAVVVIGGTLTFMDLARQYARLNGWKQVIPLEIGTIGAPNWPAWREATAARLIEATSSGDRILILSDYFYAYQGWHRKVMVAGRKVDIPFDNLSPLESLKKINEWIFMKKSAAGHAKPVRKALRFLAHLLLEKHPQAGPSEAPLRNEKEG